MTVALRSQMPSDHELATFTLMAKQAVESNMYKGIGGQAGVMMIMLAAREFGISPMMALNRGLNIIQGSIEISARMMNALIRRAGHKIIIKESTEMGCTLVGVRSDTKESAEISYTFLEAQKAGLVKTGGNWTKIPKDMCFARALSRLARQLFADVIGIGYVEGEIRAQDTAPIMPEEMPMEVEIIEETESDWIQKYLEIFDGEDQHFAMEYLRIVQKHFEWSTIQAIKEMTGDKVRLSEKFNTWKQKAANMEKKNAISNVSPTSVIQ